MLAIIGAVFLSPFVAVVVAAVCDSVQERKVYRILEGDWREHE